MLWLPEISGILSIEYVVFVLPVAKMAKKAKITKKAKYILGNTIGVCGVQARTIRKTTGLGSSTIP
jgi:hypothetical protein